MAKLPVMGQVKTRLARQVGAVEAVRFYRQTLAAVTARIGRDPRWETTLSIAPDHGVHTPVWPAGPMRRRQGHGHLGQRMQRIMDEAPPGPLIIVGTDIPAITAEHIADAFRRLRGRDGVIGPAPDGGYWLVGLRRSPRVIGAFGNVRWSHEQTREDTVANIGADRVAFAATLPDVDDATGMIACRNSFGRRFAPFRGFTH